MSDFCRYESMQLAAPAGLNNTGALCWLNSIIQAMLSLPAFHRAIIDMENPKNNVFLGNWITLVKELANDTASKNVQNPNKYLAVSQNLLSSFAVVLRQESVALSLNAQEGAANGFCVLINMLNDDYIYKVFNCKYLQTIQCAKCDKTVSSITDLSPIITMYHAVKFKTADDFRDYILAHSSTVDEFECDQCSTRSVSVPRRERLTMLREIITIVYGKLTRPNWYPLEIEFVAKSGPNMKYALTACIEHTGSYDATTHTSGGHYYARVRRNDKWFVCNDHSITEEPTPFNAGQNTHMLMYHLI